MRRNFAAALAIWQLRLGLRKVITGIYPLAALNLYETITDMRNDFVRKLSILKRGQTATGLSSLKCVLGGGFALFCLITSYLGRGI